VNLEAQIFNISSPSSFEKCALDIFKFQYETVQVYQKFCTLLDKNPDNVTRLIDIPFLPISFFKSHTIISNAKIPEKVFLSSGTTGSIPSKHFVANLKIYETSFLKTFTHFFGNIDDYVILGLLPSYLEREGSSLVYMVDTLIKNSNNPHSGFYLHNLEMLIEKISFLEKQNQKTILIGVSYALLDVLEKQQFNLKNTFIMETGGMKGKRKELIKEELHELLKKGFGVPTIYSEYGMTELLSQAYSKGEGLFFTPPWMQILTRDTNDALSLIVGKTGGINIIDLANIYSCSFIATQDLGKKLPSGGFNVLGRFDEADIRGCNLLLE
jgi:phenylacetate-coenzyme A ligase PaaK-like adenylate-forming protein